MGILRLGPAKFEVYRPLNRYKKKVGNFPKDFFDKTNPKVINILHNISDCWIETKFYEYRKVKDMVVHKCLLCHI